tara:strand:- start:308 stop:571 length:264 start_codon:yes stop_codon:yes gene_type:complete
MRECEREQEKDGAFTEDAVGNSGYLPLSGRNGKTGRRMGLFCLRNELVQRRSQLIAYFSGNIVPPQCPVAFWKSDQSRTSYFGDHIP